MDRWNKGISDVSSELSIEESLEGKGQPSLANLGGHQGGKKGVAGNKKIIYFKTSLKEEMLDITDMINKAIKESGKKEGFCLLFVPHTTAALFINEGYDPSVRKDISDSLNRLFPSSSSYSHLEGNSPAHIKSSIIGVSLFLPVEDGRLALGRWQSLFFAEFDGPRQREVWLWLL